MQSFDNNSCNDTTNRCVHSAGALPNLIKLCNTVSDREILHAAAMSLVSLAPEAEVKLRSDKEMRMLPFEVMGGVKALKRASQELYLNAGEEVPPWMQTPLDVLVPNDRPPKTGALSHDFVFTLCLTAAMTPCPPTPTPRLFFHCKLTRTKNE